MENPVEEIEGVVLSITSATNPETQKAAILRYFTPDATFRHPLCTIPSSFAAPPAGAVGSPTLPHTPSLLPLSSRDTILRIYQWYRVLSPRLTVRVRKVVYDPARHEMWLDIVQTFHLFFSPLRPAQARLATHIALRESPHPSGDPGRHMYHIAGQEDWYHPEDLMALLVPPLVPIVHFLLILGTWASVLGAWFGSVLGLWAAHAGEGGQGVELQPAGEPLPTPAKDEGKVLGG
ncbi:hypothetical protein POSPLADRAFT_1033455 [Postia placenta MAD-698-R-SB12]|uniref:SigF-like NTF2-like domain-containing protein n=1 Tax=Postia placenta MAD-698-R-SB12 TaxID=670580 RepID=A0A1X6N2B7_9APHY|nr:hypothetical protein POSPLADRAFT_1033455 [Postia placenta MAD-698-R-SB12]OSX62775.1 hypothetical protein POSPLADRAFT_1033455 [Postia placenta MAD-698-R-SB12]